MLESPRKEVRQHIKWKWQGSSPEPRCPDLLQGFSHIGSDRLTYSGSGPRKQKQAFTTNYHTVSTSHRIKLALSSPRLQAHKSALIRENIPRAQRLSPRSRPGTSPKVGIRGDVQGLSTWACQAISFPQSPHTYLVWGLGCLPKVHTFFWVHAPSIAFI